MKQNTKVLRSILYLIICFAHIVFFPAEQLKTFVQNLFYLMTVVSLGSTMLQFTLKYISIVTDQLNLNSTSTQVGVTS